MNKQDKFQKLTYKKMADIMLEINLYNGYSIIAFGLYDKDLENYKVNYYLKDNNIDTLEEVRDLENIFICSNRTINSAILKQVSKLLSNGFWDKEIEKYNYLMQCFDKGNELFEDERLGGK